MLRLRALRESKGLSQQRLAAELNVSQSTISAYEVGDRSPDMDTLITISCYFNVSLDYLAGVSDVRYRIHKSDLTQVEMGMLVEFRQLTRNDQEKVIAYMQGLHDRDIS